MSVQQAVQATLRVKRNFTEFTLIVPVDLQEPKPEHPAVLDDYMGFCYRNTVYVRTLRHDGGYTATIQTVKHSGSGQASAFDGLAGPDLRALRLKLMRQLAKLSDTGVDSRDDKNEDPRVQEVNVTLSTEDIERIRTMIQTHADGVQQHLFFKVTRTTDRVWTLKVSGDTNEAWSK